MERPAYAIALVLAAAAAAAMAHDHRAGDVVFDHPYAVPSAPGATTAAVNFRAVRNTGAAPDRIVAATTPIAAEVRLAAGGIVLAPGAQLPARHDQPTQFVLAGLRQPLHAGDSFDLTLTLEHAGRTTFAVGVVQPKAAAAH